MNYPRLPIGVFEEVKTGERSKEGLDICYKKIRFDLFRYNPNTDVYSIGQDYVVSGEILRDYDSQLRLKTYINVLRDGVAEYLGFNQSPKLNN